MTFDPHAYSITTRKLMQDGTPIFKATVSELPNLATYEESPEAAYATIVDDLEALHAMAMQHGHSFPVPLAEPSTEHNGRVTLRLPRSLHHRLSDQSAADEVSLNTCIVSLLSEALAAKAIGSAIAAAMQAQVRAVLTATELIRDAGVNGPTAVYTTTAEITIAERDEAWTKLH